MKREFIEYQKIKEFLICVDSDGSAMNTMEIKHRRCFGPCLAEEWGLQEYEEKVCWIWNAINLYSVHRGNNRFVGLQYVLEYINKHITPIAELDILKKWVETTPEFSNVALIRYLEDDDSTILPKVLHWSQSVSQHIAMLSVDERCPFDGVAEALLSAGEESDIVVVSSANPDAMLEEWEMHGLAYYVNLILSQNEGTKKYCVSELLNKGYDPGKVLMIGDAMEDLEAARMCGVCFYPIILNKEEESWRNFEIEALGRFYEGSYVGEYQDGLIEEFVQSLSASYE